jgi:hypothetical protein
MSVVYKLTNTKNGAICIGIAQNSAQERWDELVEYSKDFRSAKTNNPCLKIMVAIKKFGSENFLVETLIEDSPDKIEQIELEEIKKLNDAGITVYHRTGTFVPNEEHIDKYCSLDEDENFFYG